MNSGVQETAWLTRAMVDTGVSMDWPLEWRHLCVDKHSTGGVGDKAMILPGYQTRDSAISSKLHHLALLAVLVALVLQ